MPVCTIYNLGELTASGIFTVKMPSETVEPSPNFDGVIELEISKYWIAKYMSENDRNFGSAKELWVNDYALALLAMKASSENYTFLPEQLKHDRGIILKLLKYHGEMYDKLTPEEQRDRDYMRTAIESCPDLLKTSKTISINDQEMVVAAITKDPRAIRYLRRRYRMNGSSEEPRLLYSMQIALLAVRKDGMTLEYLPSRYKKDRIVVTAALRQNHWAIRFADPSMWFDPEIAGIVEECALSNIVASVDLTCEGDPLIHTITPVYPGIDTRRHETFSVERTHN
jgi:hypothetical protein